MADSTPINVRKPNGETFTVKRETIRYHESSSPLCVIFVGETLTGRPVTFRPNHLVRVRRVDIGGSSMRPAGIRYVPVDNTERDQRELDAINRRVKILEAKLNT